MRILGILRYRSARGCEGLLGVPGICVTMNGGTQAEPWHRGKDGRGRLVPGPWLRLRLAGKSVLPGRFAQRLGEASLGFLIQAFLSRQQTEHGNQSDRQSNLPAWRLAPAEEVEEELHRPPFRHQIPLPIRRGEVESRRRQRHHASVTAQRLARSTERTADRPSRAASRPC